MRIRVRKAEQADVNGMLQLFRETVRAVNVADYSVEETEEWAACGEDCARWEYLMKQFHFVVAEVVEGKSNRAVPAVRTGDEKMVGFSAVSDDGDLHSMFVHKDYQGCGVATALLQTVEAYAVGYGVRRLHSEVSITARPFFERKGFRVVREQKRRAKRLELTNFVMEKEVKETKRANMTKNK